MKKYIQWLTLAFLMFLMPSTIFAKEEANEQLGIVIGRYTESENIQPAIDKLGADEETRIFFSSGSDSSFYFGEIFEHEMNSSSVILVEKNTKSGVIVDVMSDNKKGKMVAEFYQAAMVTAGMKNLVVKVSDENPLMDELPFLGTIQVLETYPEYKLKLEDIELGAEELAAYRDYSEFLKNTKERESLAQTVNTYKKELINNQKKTNKILPKETVEKEINKRLDKAGIKIKDKDAMKKLVDFLFVYQENETARADGTLEQLTSLGEEENSDNFWMKMKTQISKFFRSIAKFLKVSKDSRFVAPAK